jgi:Flp pilus assembly protein TadG
LPGRSRYRSLGRQRMTPLEPAVERRMPSLRGEKGAAAVEFAIVASIFFMLVFGIIDFGFGFHTWNATANAAREGARRAAVSSDVNGITARVRASANWLDQTKLAVTVTCARGSGAFVTCPAASSWLQGDFVRVTVDYAYKYMTPLPAFVGMGTTLNLHSVSETTFEG